LWELDLQKRTIFLSSTYFAMLGYKAVAFNGPYDTEYSYIHPDDRSKMETLVEKIKKAIPQVTISMYLSFVTTLTLVMGLVFETPLVMWAVVRGGLVTTASLRRSRKIAILGILVFAAVATPPDPFTMLFVAAPMIVLYEVGLVVSARAERALAGRDGSRL
jgi:Sec-independent protein secretion pathway component TatC